MRKTISIISDWQKEDYYLASLKTRLQQLVSGCQLMDISHNIHAFDSMQAAFVLRSVWEEFPAGSIHLNCVNAASSPRTPHVLVVHKQHFFIGADLGYWPFILKGMPEKAYILNDEIVYKGSSFPELTIFAPLAAALSRGISPGEMGAEEYQVRSLTNLNPEFGEGRISASIVYFDSYGNAITNLTEEDFYKHVPSNKFRISLQSERNQTKRIAGSYSNVKPGEMLALFNSQNFLEIAMREGNIQQLLNLELGAQVRIDFDL